MGDPAVRPTDFLRETSLQHVEVLLYNAQVCGLAQCARAVSDDWFYYRCVYCSYDLRVKPPGDFRRTCQPVLNVCGLSALCRDVGLKGQISVYCNSEDLYILDHFDTCVCHDQIWGVIFRPLGEEHRVGLMRCEAQLVLFAPFGDCVNI